MSIRVKFVTYGEHARVKVVDSGQDMDVVSVASGEDLRVKRVQDGEVFKVRLVPNKYEGKYAMSKSSDKDLNPKTSTLIAYVYKDDMPDLSKIMVFRPLSEKLWKKEK